MNIDKHLERLGQIKEVDAPPFLLTRIQEKIRSASLEPASATWKWAFGVAAMLILVLNIEIISKATSGQSRPAVEALGGMMHLSTSNALYDK